MTYLEFYNYYQEIEKLCAEFANLYCNNASLHRWGYDNIELCDNEIYITIGDYYNDNHDCIEISIDILLDNTKWESYIDEQIKLKKEKEQKQQEKYIEQYRQSKINQAVNTLKEYGIEIENAKIFPSEHKD